MWRSLLKQQRKAQTIKRYFSSSSSTGEPQKPDALMDQQVNCLMLHPVTWPHHGPHKELYLAEEAIGLVRSLDWDVAKGPLWRDQEKEDRKREQDEARLASNDDDGADAVTTEQLTSEDGGGTTSASERMTFRQRRSGMRFSHARNAQQFKEERITDGDYVYGPDMQGVFYKKGGIIMELDSKDDDSIDLYDEWKNVLLRESVAKSSLVKCRKIHSSTYFTKGKLNELGYFLKDNKRINVVFVNAQLTALQQKKLEKRFNDIILSREDRLRKYYLKSAQRERFNPTDVDSESSQMSELEVAPSQNGGPQRKIRVIDRFGIILQIFALRAKTRAAQLQLELAWLKYARTMLVRGGAPTFGQLGNIFQGNMMRMEVQEVEIKSARGRKSGGGGTIGGEGETQLELERRRLTDREAKITGQLEQLRLKADHEKMKKEQTHQTLPLIGLIGYTNAGKTALMNLCTGAELESRDLLFQTLNTTHKRFRMPNGQMGLMLDTVGFITNLPHGLVESFKATLEEIHYVDLLVHVRDISHPQSNYQRDTVLKVLKEIGVPDEILAKKYVEVWNKIDLIEDQSEFQEQLKQDLADTTPHYPVVMMSCTNGTNKDLFLNQVQQVTQSLMGKKPITLTYSYRMHDKVTRWLFEHASINSVEDVTYREDGTIELRVPIDEVVYHKYLKHFENEKFEDKRGGQRDNQTTAIKKGRLAPPAGWNNKS